MNSMMPKGVEHNSPVPICHGYQSVMNSMMPKGVEHSLPYQPGTQPYTVMNSMMPKGVEHFEFVDHSRCDQRDEFDDAERR